MSKTASHGISKDDAINAIFEAISSSGVSYAILSGPLVDLGGSDGDIDFAADQSCKPQAMLLIINRAVKHKGWRIVRVVQHEAEAYSAVLVGPAPQHERIALDWCTNFGRDGMDLLQSQFLLAGKYKEGSYWYASETVRFAYTLTKSLAKRREPGEFFSRLKQLSICSPQVCLETAALLLGKKNSDELAACLRSDHRPDKETTKSWRDELARTHPSSISTRAREVWRLVKRSASPTGIVAVFLGPDGVGKTTAIASVSRSMQHIFRTVDTIHFRPHIFVRKPVEGTCPEPHRLQARSDAASILKLLFYYLDHLAGYFFRILPKKIRNGAVLFDRHFSDVVVDWQRYRLRQIPCLPRLLLRLLPSPDIVICFRADPSTIRTRKSELTEVEISRQMTVLDKLSEEFRKAVFIDASAPAQEVHSAVRETIFSCLAERCSSRWL